MEAKSQRRKPILQRNRTFEGPKSAEKSRKRSRLSDGDQVRKVMRLDEAETKPSVEEVEPSVVDKPISQSDIKDNSTTAIASDTSDVHNKKITISEEEKMMNGAPEGDLYDVTVLEDDELIPLPSDSDAESIFLAAKSQYFTLTSWADKYGMIEQVRTIIKHHSKLISGDSYSFLIDMTCDGVNSLRSCFIRNSLLLSKSVLQSFANNNGNASTFRKLFATLVNRMSSGPRFLCDMSHDILSSSISLCSVVEAIDVLFEFSNHKNADVASKVQSLLAHSCIENIDSSMRECVAFTQILPSLYQSLFSGLHSKRSASKDKAKDAFRKIHKVFGKEWMTSSMESASLTSVQVSEVFREMSIASKKPLSEITGKKALSDITNKAAAPSGFAAWKQGLKVSKPSVPVVQSVAKVAKVSKPSIIVENIESGFSL